jgi:hypothetical protein
MSLFEGFDLGDVVEIRIRSFTVAAGGSAQLVAIELDVYHADIDEPEVLAVDYHGDGPTLAGAQATVRTINRLLGGRGGAASP